MHLDCDLVANTGFYPDFGRFGESQSQNCVARRRKSAVTSRRGIFELGKLSRLANFQGNFRKRKIQNTALFPKEFPETLT